MRSELQMRNLLLDTARQDERIRAVLLNGSRANPQAERDHFQDYDIVYIVTDLNSFTRDHSWIRIFGELTICQMPDQMTIGERASNSFAYLMLFKDGNRVDLTLLPLISLSAYKPESLTKVWLDKDGLFQQMAAANERDYFISAPSEAVFLDTCNEFWWVSTYVAKGLARQEIIYAKDMLNTVVRPMFMQVIAWKIGIEFNFAVSFGKSGKYTKRYLPKEDYEKLLLTYADHQLQNNWTALFLMTELFSAYAHEVASKARFAYNALEQEHTLAYLKRVYEQNR